MADRIFAALGDRPVSINLTGGEPLLLPHLVDLLDHLVAFPSLDEVNVITNGTRTPGDVLEWVASCDTLGAIKLSVESADAVVNDAIRGPGAFERVLGNLERFRSTGKAVVLMVTLSRANVATIGQTVDLAVSEGLAGVIFERFIPLGRGRGIMDQVLSAREWSDAALVITGFAGLEVDDAVDLLPYRAFWLETSTSGAFAVRGALCNLGDESMALMPDGTVYPCRRLPIAVGNVSTDRFADTLAELARYAMAETKPRLGGLLCGRCDVEGCAGCRALAYALTGDPFADGPQCPR